MGKNWAKLRDCFHGRSYNGIKKKCRKLLGETINTKYPKSVKSINHGKNENEIQALLELHKRYRYKMRAIATVLRTNKSEAELERMIYQSCECKTCLNRRTEIHTIMDTHNETFKDAWTRYKARERKNEFLERKQKIENDYVKSRQ